MRNLFLLALVTLAICTIECHEEDGPDVRVLNEIMQDLWDKREDILVDSLPNLPLDDEDFWMLKDELVELMHDAKPEEHIDCAPCLVFANPLGTAPKLNVEWTSKRHSDRVCTYFERSADVQFRCCA